MSKTIHDLQNEYAQALSSLAPAGCSPVVALLDRDRRKKRKDASASRWDPMAGSISVTFVKEEEGTSTPVSKAAAPSLAEVAEPVLALSRPLTDAIRVLDAAERKVSFVALKWFRDQVLPNSGLPWATAPSVGQEIIKEAIERGLFLTNKVLNPKAPAFPTTAIRLNRHSPEVQKVLGTSSMPSNRKFQPVNLSGEPLSATVIRERD